ncbi:MAG: 1-acyl-sn-glycerol-3-phosphate acyltransferase [Myxococcaceae bacterium]|nr:1-acyl-sn-glycerol-3-phosphate acyltransferase [Myxococcaceae bacterium]MCA3011259.1 1-acyl-sn-glycerol-3-phosphate acyltransferase [Myxococcaceae bacterium]
MRNLFCIFIAGVWTTLLFPVTILVTLLTFDTSTTMWVVQRVWSPVLLWAGGAKLTVRGLERADFTRPAIYVCNHQSTIDIPALFLALPVNFRFVAKQALQYVPVLGWYMTMAKFVFIDRSNHKKAIRSLERAGERIRGGISIAMFPEGTRSPDLAIMPFKKGPFALAMKAGVPVVPIAIEGSGRLMPKNSWNITPGPITIAIGAPVDPAPFGDDREALMKAVRDRIIDLSVELGGRGGDKATTVAAKGLEGTARRRDTQAPA